MPKVEPPLWFNTTWCILLRSRLSLYVPIFIQVVSGRAHLRPPILSLFVFQRPPLRRRHDSPVRPDNRITLESFMLSAKCLICKATSYPTCIDILRIHLNTFASERKLILVERWPIHPLSMKSSCSRSLSKSSAVVTTSVLFEQSFGKPTCEIC